MLQIIFVVTK